MLLWHHLIILTRCLEMASLPSVSPLAHHTTKFLLPACHTVKFLLLLTPNILDLSFSWLLIQVFQILCSTQIEFPKNSSLTIMNSYSFCLENNPSDLAVNEWQRLTAKCILAGPAESNCAPAEGRAQEDWHLLVSRKQKRNFQNFGKCKSQRKENVK